MNRQEILKSLKEKPEISVLIVGAGINGIGTFRDLALNGVDVLLVDRADFCSGASAASSHMAHGGIRYLENGEFRLVREAVGERNRMIRNAPHLVKPLPTTIPMFKWFSGLLNAPLKFMGWLDRPSERGSVVIKIGLIFYDAFTGRQRSVPRHQFRGRKESLKNWSLLNPTILNTATYYDGAILNPERYCLELMLDAEAEGAHARSLNYVNLAGASSDTVLLRDEVTGEMVSVKPRLLINAAGPWIDFANRTLGMSTRFIGGTKGSHLVIDHPKLRETIGENEFFFENKDGRIVLIFPLYDKVLIGTSDIPIENPDESHCEKEEIEYFLGMIERVFPDVKVTPDQIVFQFSGVRPLAYSNAKTTGQITRDHTIQVMEGPWTGLSFPVYSLVGGKWTSYRAFSEEVTDKTLKLFGMARQKDTCSIEIGGGRAYPQTPEAQKRFTEGVCAWVGLPLERVQVLFERYGTRVEQVCGFIAREKDIALKSLPDYSRREIAFLGQVEKVIHLDDLILRRSMLTMLGRLNRERVDELAQALGEALGWNDMQREAEVSRATALLADHYGVHL